MGGGGDRKSEDKESFHQSADKRAPNPRPLRCRSLRWRPWGPPLDSSNQPGDLSPVHFAPNSPTGLTQAGCYSQRVETSEKIFPCNDPKRPEWGILSALLGR